MAAHDNEFESAGPQGPGAASPNGAGSKPPPLPPRPSSASQEAPTPAAPSQPAPATEAPETEVPPAAPDAEIPSTAPVPPAAEPERAASQPAETDEAETAETDEAEAAETKEAEAAETKEAEAAETKEAETAETDEAETAETDEAEAAETVLLTKPRRSFFAYRAVRSAASFLLSMFVHLIVVIVLALYVLPAAIDQSFAPLVAESVEDYEDLETTFLEETTEAATEMIFGPSSGDPTVGQENSNALDLHEVSLDESLTEEPVEGTRVDIDGTFAAMMATGMMTRAVPEGTPGKARHVVDGYQQAMDRITQEILLMLYKGPVIAIWVFDQSESMKDDQKEIRDRIERVYAELGLSEAASGDRLVTAVTSFGEYFRVHTEQPTADLDLVRKAIDEVPIDPSGQEVMCQAVGKSITLFRKYATKGRRRMVVILVTDESGNRDDNLRFIEPTIAVAQAARCNIFVLGREACFGYPYVFFRFKHPQTGRIHWLRVDRGPETAFVEQLQINGFRRRHDAFPSGFGPWEQSRMARETGGIFFLLPSLETKLVRGEKRRYELEAMQFYQPDLRARMEIIADRDRFELRTFLWGIISQFNPYNPSAAQVIELRVEFSPNPQEFVRQAAKEQQKAIVYLQYLDKAEKEVEKQRFLRERESEPRWNANFDLLYAQIITFKVQVYEYGAYLEEFVKNPKVVPLTKPPNLRLTNWDITTRKEMLTADQTQPYMDKASELLKQLIKDHPGTPWAARAQWELRRGFGVQLVPEYEPPYKDVDNPIPLPKL